jgi:hypothetical protein
VGPEVGNLAAGDGEPGQAPARGAGIRGAVGWQRIPKADPHELMVSGRNRPGADARISVAVNLIVR